MADKVTRRFDALKIITLILVFIIGVTFAYHIQKPPFRLPVINPADLNPALVADSLEGKGLDHTISDFRLTDQTGTVRTLSDLKGKIIVADFFFATCPGICVDMTRNLRKVQSAYTDEPMLHILSHSVTPKIDSVEALREYGELNGIDSDRWWLLTGDKEQIYNLAYTSYFAVMEAGSTFDEHQMIHTENLIVVDPKGRLRGFYDGTSDEEVALMIEHLESLIGEFK